MKVNNKSLKEQKPHPYQQQILEYIKLKPQRAVQRLLQQNDIESSFEFYNNLQDTVKQNTQQLRSVLYKNHENLFACSQTIQKIQNFSTKVKQIQMEINGLINQKIAEQYMKFQKNIHSNNIIAQIQQLMEFKKYSQALTLCGRNFQKNQIQSDDNLLYLKFIKVQIVQNIEKQMNQQPLTQLLIKQTILALIKFMEITNIQEIQQIIQQVGQDSFNLDKYRSNKNDIFKLIYELASSNETMNYPLNENQIIQVIFKYKLFGINSESNRNLTYESESERIQIIYQRIYQFFNDLNKLLMLSQEQKSKLSEIFKNNTKMIINHISEILIVDMKKRQTQIYLEGLIDKKLNNFGITISFETEIYQKLLNSHEFITVVKELEKNLYNQNEQNDDLILLISNLWKDFYQQLLDIVFQKVNPLTNFKIQIKKRNHLPEFKKFIVSNFSKLTKLKITNYKKQLNTFFENYNQLIKKSKNNDKKQIEQYLIGLVQKAKIQMNQFFKQKIQQLAISTNVIIQQSEIRELMILFFLVQLYYHYWQKILSEKGSNRFNQYNQMVQYFHTELYSLKQLCFEIFTQENQSINYFIKILDFYVNQRVKKTRIVSINVSQIQRWQQQVDLLFGQYPQSIIEDEYLIEKMKKLILILIQYKLSLIQ